MVCGAWWKVQGSSTSTPVAALGEGTLLVHQLNSNFLTEMCSGSEAGSYLELIDYCITQL